ncbi:hypothetical protein NZK35_11120 [Stieleria sp. ICT_E10.1]|uniref:hypothetical protein n=1 Tax=Stieleria sedimenti TaxID=2976331 RepID=UPI00217F9E9D|nr:hypothetical protein [Stieleria sedimenti]MCS7467194.1 hypothetical protein [Stieleria sedimenti]
MVPPTCSDPCGLQLIGHCFSCPTPPAINVDVWKLLPQISELIITDGRPEQFKVYQPVDIFKNWAQYFDPIVIDVGSNTNTSV